MNVFGVIGAVGSLATAVAVFVAVWQLAETRRQAQTQFEDQLSREYRSLVQDLPVEALLGEKLADEQHRGHLAGFLHYVDLTNEQIFLRQQNRVSKDTWLNWRDGIEATLRRPAFARAWEEIKARSDGSFTELRRLEASGFRDDPNNWRSEPGRPLIATTPPVDRRDPAEDE